MHYVYVLACSDGSYYTGYTTDVDRRVAEHDAGDGAKYTRGRTPVELVHVEAYDSQSVAMQREHEIKQLRRSEKEEIVDQSDAVAPDSGGAEPMTAPEDETAGGD